MFSGLFCFTISKRRNADENLYLKVNFQNFIDFFGRNESI